MSNVFDSNPIPLNDDFAVTRQLQGLVNAVNDLQNQLTGLSQATATVARAGSAGSIINFLRNTDLNTADAGRRQFTYTTPDDAANVCAFWYAPDNAAAGPFVDSTATVESADAIAYVQVGEGQGGITTGTPNLVSIGTLFSAGMVTKRCIVVGAGVAGANLDTIIDAFIDSQHVTLHDNAGTTVVDANVLISNPAADTVWYAAGGSIWMGGSSALMSPLQKNYARPGVGNSIFIIFNVRLNPLNNAVPITTDYTMRLSVYDDTTGQQKIIEGAPITITATLDRGSGAVIRQYVVRYLNASGDSFLSSAGSPASVPGTPSPLAGDPGQITVTYPMYQTVQSVQIFRSDDETSLSDYYLLDTVSTGIDNIQDNGGRSGAIYNFGAEDPWLCDAILPNIGKRIGTPWSFFVFHALTPATYNLDNTDPNSQWLRLDFLDSAGALATIPAMALEFDFFGLSYAQGTWQPSSDDQAAAGDFTSNSPSPSGSIPDPDPDPTPGGGGRGRIGDLGF